MNESLKVRLASVKSDQDFLELCREMSRENQQELFDDVWRLAVSERVDGTPTTAAFLLAKLDLPTQRTAEDLLRELASQSWDLSNRVVPFYLVTHFGQKVVLDTISLMASKLGKSKEKTLLEGVAYWARQPAEGLIEPLHYFEWQEVIEGNEWSEDEPNVDQN